MRFPENGRPFFPALAAFLCLALSWTPAGAESSVPLSVGQTVYVPAYSHIYGGNRERPFYLAVTLSIRNTDPNHPLTVRSADYFDSAGNRVKTYLKDPLELGPMASTRIGVKESDKAGGSGANFLVMWESGTKVTPPIIESVMIGTQTQQGISFTSRGRVIRERCAPGD